MESGVWTVDELYNKMKEFSPSPSDSSTVYVKKWFKELLEKRYRDIIYITNDEKRFGVVCLKDRVPLIIRNFLRSQGCDSEVEIIHTAAKILLQKIKTTEMNSTVYPGPDDLSKPCPAVPELLKLFMNHFFKTPELSDIHSQFFVKSARPRSGPLPFLLGLGVEMDHQFGSKWLIERLRGIGVSESYKEVANYKWNVLKSDLERISGASGHNPMEDAHPSTQDPGWFEPTPFPAATPFQFSDDTDSDEPDDDPDYANTAADVSIFSTAEIKS